MTATAKLPAATACVTVLSNVTSIENQAAADQASGSLSTAAHDYTVGAAQIRHDVALFNSSAPVAVAAREMAGQAAKIGRRLAAKAKRHGDDTPASLPNLRTSALKAACA